MTLAPLEKAAPRPSTRAQRKVHFGNVSVMVKSVWQEVAATYAAGAGRWSSVVARRCQSNLAKIHM